MFTSPFVDDIKNEVLWYVCSFAIAWFIDMFFKNNESFWRRGRADGNKREEEEESDGAKGRGRNFFSKFRVIGILEYFCLIK